MRRVPVTSEAVRSIGYEGRTLEVEFIDGDVYQYYGVPEIRYAELMLSESIGRYIVAHIRDDYRYTRVG